MSDVPISESESAGPDGKLITELKVAELRSELEKRGKDKNGVKASLTDRLAAALREEGHDPDQYLFTLTTEMTPTKGSAAKRKSGSGSKVAREDGDDKRNGDDVELESNGAPASATTDSQLSLEADNIVQDALQLAENDELNEYRDIEMDGKNEADSSKRTSKATPALESRKESSSQSSSASGTATPAPAADSGSKSSRSSRPADANTSKSSRPTDAEKNEESEPVSAVVSAGDSDLDLEPGVQATPTSGKKNPKVTSTKKDGDEKSGRRDGDRNRDGKTSATPAVSSKAKTRTSGGAENSGSKDEKNDAPDRNIWVSGLGQNTRASDLQTVFKKYGKVVGAKIITNTRIPGSRYYGLITMETKEQAEKCIQNLNKTELNGKTITVEKNRPNENASVTSGKDRDVKEAADKSRREKDADRDKNRSKDKHRDRSRDKEKDKGKDRAKERGRDKDKSSRKSKSPAKVRDGRKSPIRRNRSRSPFRARGLALRGGRGMPLNRPFIPRDVRMNPAELRRIEQERLARRRERIVRETEQRRLDEDRRQREMLQIEAEKLRRERELLEKEKAELLRLEREKARLERERIEREKEELMRKVNHERDFSRSRPSAPSSQPGLKRQFDSRDHDPYWDSDRKRQGIPDPLAPATRMPFDATSARFEFDSRGAAPAVTQERFPVRSSGDYGMDNRRDNGRPDRDDRARALATAAVANPGFYRSDMRDSRNDSRRGAAAGARGDEGNWKSESRRDRPPPTVSSMISVSGSAVGPQGMYSTPGAPLGPIMSHSSLSSAAPIGSAQMDSRSYVPMRRFPS